MTEQKVSTWIGFLVIALVIFPTAWISYGQWSDIENSYNHRVNNVVNDEKEQDQEASEISDAEKKQIDAWIVENNLNQYGDPVETVYPGGTPLFNEMTGEQIDKYEYILKNHPEKPWNK